MIKILIIGCGEFGSRHLQALSFLQEPAKILLVDSSNESLSIAIDRFNSVYDKDSQSLIEVICFKNIEDVKDDIDIAIVSTSSRARISALSCLLDSISLRYIILEKFLFQSLNDFKQAQLLIDKSDTKVYVNQWLSSDYFFSRIARWFDSSNKFNMKVSGGNWGLSCNSIHFVDYFETLINGNITKTIGDLSRVYPAKRDGYYEFNGSITLNTDSGSELEIVSNNVPGDDVNILIESENKKVCLVIKPNQQVFASFIDSHIESNEVGCIPFQSKMTHLIVQELMSTGNCKLPNYERSSRQQMLLLPIFDKYIRENTDWNGLGCPIT